MPVAALKLPKGKYLVTVSFLLYSSNSWLYGGFKHDREILFSSQGFYVTPSKNVPIIGRRILEVQQEMEIEFVLYEHHSWPSQICNFIMTAERVN